LVRLLGLSADAGELGNGATCGIQLLPHHRASLAAPSTNNCAFGHDFREAALTNTGRPWPDLHRKVASEAVETQDPALERAADRGSAAFFFGNVAGPLVRNSSVV